MIDVDGSLVDALTPQERECYMKTEYELKYYTKYSYSDCYEECILEYAYQELDCLPWSRPSIYTK